MSLLNTIKLNRQEVLNIVERNHAVNARLFGSVARGEETVNSDIDILVDPLPETTLLDLGGIQIELEKLLGARVDLLTPKDLPESFREALIASALPLKHFIFQQITPLPNRQIPQLYFTNPDALQAQHL